MRRILVLRLGALGDFVLSFPAFAAIRAHHASDHITLLTTAPFASLAMDSPWFDSVEVDARPRFWDTPGVVRLRRQLAGYDFVYDLQTSSRSSRYFFLAGMPKWSGIAPLCSHPHANPHRNTLHTVARQRDQLAMAGVTEAVAPNLAWLARGGPVLPPPYALLIPGTSAAHGGAKRWPVERFAALAGLIKARGATPVVVGGAGDGPAAAAIRAAVPAAKDLTGKTSLQDLAGLAARAAVAVGGDTGPMHLAAMMGCPVVALYSRFSNPDLAAPVGTVALLRAHDLVGLAVARVAAVLPDQY